MWLDGGMVTPRPSSRHSHWAVDTSTVLHTSHYYTIWLHYFLWLWTCTVCTVCMYDSNPISTCILSAKPDTLRTFTVNLSLTQLSLICSCLLQREQLLRGTVPSSLSHTTTTTSTNSTFQHSLTMSVLRTTLHYLARSDLVLTQWPAATAHEWEGP